MGTPEWMMEAITPFSSVLVANRGEIAVRVLRAVRECGLRGIAVYNDLDSNSMHLNFADEKIKLPGETRPLQCVDCTSSESCSGHVSSCGEAEGDSDPYSSTGCAWNRPHHLEGPDSIQDCSRSGTQADDAKWCNSSCSRWCRRCRRPAWRRRSPGATGSLAWTRSAGSRPSAGRPSAA